MQNGGDMAERKTITVNQDIAQIISEAAELWPEISNNYSMLVCKIISEWARLREERAVDTGEINRRLDKHESLLLGVIERIDRIERTSK
jgi:hypothetical protein